MDALGEGERFWGSKEPLGAAPASLEPPTQAPGPLRTTPERSEYRAEEEEGEASAKHASFTSTPSVHERYAFTHPVSPPHSRPYSSSQHTTHQSRQRGFLDRSG